MKTDKSVHHIGTVNGSITTGNNVSYSNTQQEKLRENRSSEEQDYYSSQVNPVKKTILVLAAHPKPQQEFRLIRLNEEIREINEGLQLAKNREHFRLESVLAVRPLDIHRAILDLNPQIVHFSGHGVKNEGIMLEDETGNIKKVTANALASLFELFSEEIQCVLLNACYSKLQAEAISRHIDYVIGMNNQIRDITAIKFSIGFYDALAAGKSIEFAYKLGCSAIQFAATDDRQEEHLIPQMWCRGKLI